MSLIFPYLQFIRYYFKSGNAHGLHSPFVYDLYTNAIRIHRSKGLIRLNSSIVNDQDLTKGHGSSDIMWGEILRTQLMSSKRRVEVEDLGGGSIHTPGLTRQISKIAKWSGRRPRAGKLLFRLTHYFKPEWILELGTSLGIGTLYLHQACPIIPLTTVEGSTAIAEIARDNLKEFERISVINSSFDRFFDEWQSPQGVGLIMIDGDHQYGSVKRYFNFIANGAHNETVLIFDDIHWSKGMEKAWKEICEDNRVRVTIDLFTFGIVFFKKELSRQHFVLWNKDCF